MESSEEIKVTEWSPYFRAASNSIHVLALKLLEELKNQLPAAPYLGIASDGLTELPAFIDEEKAVQVELKGLPLPRIANIRERDDNGETTYFKERWIDGVWKFKTVYVAQVSYYRTEYDDVFKCGTSLLVGKDRKEVLDFLQRYADAKWKRYRQGLPCILTYSGSRISEFRKADWKEVFLPNDMTNEIRQEIDTFFKNEAAYKEHGLDWRRGIMLAGRPGNGKTLLARAIATTAKVPVIYGGVDQDDFFHILNSVDKTIKANAPCIVVFEDADSLASNQSTRSAFLNMLDGLFSASGVLTIASTNAPQKLDEAFTGRPSRFDSFYIIDDPQPAERKKILLNRLKNKGSIPDKLLDPFLTEMDGLSAACIQEIAVGALLESLNSGKTLNLDMLKRSLAKVKKHIHVAETGLGDRKDGQLGFQEKAILPSKFPKNT
jgi:hypothetical protein